MAEWKVLNLYAGLGGNRKLWEDVDVTAIEHDEKTASIYRDNFPGDTVVVGDAHTYLAGHHGEFDFIWASPPCPTHSRIRKVTSGEDEQNDPVYPDMRLYQEILFLDGHFHGDWVVENVESWYDPLVQPVLRGRHYFWSNFYISEIEVEPQDNQNGRIEDWEGKYGFDLSGYDLPHGKRRKLLRNCVGPELGSHVLDAARSNRQTTLEEAI